MNETRTTDSPAEPSTSAGAQTTPSEVVVRYRYADGILLEGDTYPHKDAVKKSQPRWRWFRSLRKWGVPRTRDRVMSSTQVEQYARGLRDAGVPNVRVDFEEPKPEDVRDFGEVLEERKERAQDRAERLEQRADRLEAQAVAEHGKHRAVLDRIPMGQPILVGHHSEGRHRRDLARADASMRRSIAAQEGAKEARSRAVAAERGAAKHEKPGFALRRLLDLRKEARELEVRITGEVPTGWRGHTPSGPATGEYLTRLQTAAEQNRKQAEHYRGVLDGAGYMPSSQAVLRKGDRVITDKGAAVVQRTLSKYAELRFDRAIRWSNGPHFVQRTVYSRVWVPKATVERHGEPEPAPEPEAPEATAQRPQEPPKKPSARKRISHREAVTRSPLATLVAKHPKPERYVIGQVVDALVEAERLGLGPKLAQYFRSTHRPEDVQRAYGRARGIVAFERDGWPPSPLRGQTYGANDFGGLLTSLDHEPTVAELLEVLREWPERMKPITGGRHLRWFPGLLRDANALIHDHRAAYERKVVQGEDATPSLAVAARDALVADAVRRLHDLREVQDPTLYDPTSDPEAVYPRICKIDSTAARMVLEEVFGVEFNWEDKEAEASELCGGEITLATLAEGAATRAKEEAERKERQRVLRQADAREEASKGAAPPRSPTDDELPKPKGSKEPKAIEKPAAHEPEDTKVADAIEEEPMADEKNTPTPRGEAAPGSLWTVEEEGFALTAPPGEGRRAQVPMAHQPALFDVGKPDPAVLERMRAEELAERRAKRPPPDTSDPLLTQATSEPTAIGEDQAAPPESPSASATDPTPPTASEAQAPAAPKRQPAPAGRRHPFEPLPSTQRLSPGVIERQVRAILTNRIADDGPDGVSEFSTKHEPRHARVIKAMAKRGVVKLVTAPRGYVRIMAGPKWGAAEEPKPKPPAKPKPTPKKAGGSSSKRKTARTPKAASLRDTTETTIREGGIVAFQHEESGSTTRFGVVVRRVPGNRTAEIHAPQWFPLTGIRAVQSGGDPEFQPSLKRYYLDELTNVRCPVPSDIGADGLRLMKRATKNWVDLRPVGGGPSWDAFVALRNLGLMHRNEDVDLGGEDGSWPGPPFVVEPTDLGHKVLASLDPGEVNLATRRYVPPRHRAMGRVFPIGEDLDGPDENIRFYVLEDTFVPTDDSRGYPVGRVVAYDDYGNWRVLDGFTMGPLHDDPEWEEVHAYPDEQAARDALKPSRSTKGKAATPKARSKATSRPAGRATAKGSIATEAVGLTSNAPAANNRPPPPEPPDTVAPIELSPALARRVKAEQAKLRTMPKHQDPSFRPVVVVAWKGRRRPDVFSRYHTEPLGTLVTIDGHYDRAQIVAELGPSSGPPNGGGAREPRGEPPSPSGAGNTGESSPPPLDSFEEDLVRSVIDMGDGGLAPDNADESRALEGMADRGLVEKTDEDRYRATPLARLEYVDVATGVPADPGEPGTLSTGRIVADIDGETVEIEEDDLIGRGTDPDPRKRRYRFDVDSPADYPGQAQAKKATREAEKTASGKKGKGKTGKPKKGKGAVAGLRATFDSPAKAAKVFYDQNDDFFDNVVDPWDGLRDWMDGIEVRVGRGHRKLSKTKAGQRILGQKHASDAIRGALAYLFGQAKGRRWENVPWDQVERLGEVLERYFEEPSSMEPSMSGLYWRPFAGKVRAEDLDVMTPEQRASIREQESVEEIGEQLEELKEANERAKDCLPDDLRRVIERRVAEWSRWVEEPSKIPDYACEPDPETAGYLCNYPAVAGELRQLRKSCEDAYDPNWAARQSKAGAPGFPDTSYGEDEELPPQTASAKACCSRETPKAEVCSAPACQVAAGLVGEPKAANAQASKAADQPTAKAKPKAAKTSGKSGKPSSKAGKPPDRGTKKTSKARNASRSASSTKPKRTGKPTAAERKRAAAERKKATEQRRKLTAAERRAHRLECSAAVAKKQVEEIDTNSYRRRVEDAGTAVKEAEKHVKHHERDLKTALREAEAVMRNRKAIPLDRQVARGKVRESRCQLNVAHGALRQRKRDHQRAQTELERAVQRVKRREVVAAERLARTKKAKDEAAALAKSRR